ncbi:hypothetical protein F9L33_01270 [Amylibacter sp. SFDW26]|uniref:DUF6165 family protein n=1 Tax=Amylibacter sp. SFDW26 TaxID=2652722 RepID=UPI0012621E13|nr:DUF6165 family protein [Amylibacter sp. SFDW26]KAB7615425.1 hypothetical protein F9L33_01270 [Amylibacter sp. SFDW26]
MSDILTPIAPGELLDKLTILQIKSENISDAAKLKNVHVEQAALQAVAKVHIPDTDELTSLTSALLTVNKELWDIEDDIRDCERAGDFGDEFIRLARAVYVTNDKRADLKKQINIAMGSALVEEKSYAAY